MSITLTAEDLCVQALELSPEARETFLDRACRGRTTLRQEVDSLLKKVGSVDAQFDSGPEGEGEQDLAGTVIADRYTLTARIGRGGMGEVWAAEQSTPIRRSVAVKVVRAGLGYAGLLGRFAAERQAVALLDHPNVAKLYDAGTTADGRPYFVMELVAGMPLSAFQRDLQPGLRQRLEVFRQVCGAVQHAHQRGVIHRDLKPGNILVEEHDGKAVAKVIDFGLAKAAGAVRLTDETLATAFGAVMGTPLYMAPEQAGGNPADVDTRADVWALGVILYELLTGTTPLSSDDLRDQPLDEIVRRVREQDPPPPSQRTGGVRATPLSPPPDLPRRFPRELDWVVQKALSRERERRYESAAALSNDVERFLLNEPVAAGPPSRLYRAGKFVRRHRGPVTAAALLLLALLGGFAGTAWGLLQAEEKRKQAETNEGLAKESADAERIAKQDEATQRADANRAKDQMFNVMDAMVSDDAAGALNTQRKLTPRQAKFLASVLPFYREMAAEKGTDQIARARAAYGAHRLGVIEYDLGRAAEAEKAFEAARAQYAALAEQFPETVAHRTNLGRTCGNLAVMLRGQGRREEAKAVYAQAVAVQSALAKQYPDSPEYREDVARTRNNLGILFLDLRQVKEARAEYDAVIADYRALVAAVPLNVEYRGGLADGLANLGLLLKDLAKRAEAKGCYEEAIRIREGVVRDQPKEPGHRARLAATRGQLGGLLNDLGERGEARKAFTEAVDEMEKLAAEFPNVIDHRADLARLRHNFGRLLAAQGRATESVAELKRAVASFAKLAADVPTVPEYRHGGAASQQHLGDELNGLGKTSEARAAFEEALKLWEGLIKEFPNADEYRLGLATTCNNFGAMVAETEGRAADAQKLFARGVEALTPLPANDPEATFVLRNCHANRALALDRIGKSGDAVPHWEAAIELSSPGERTDLRAKLALSLADIGNLTRAVAELDDLRKLTTWTAQDWYHFSWVYALASVKLPDRREEYGAVSVEMVRKAINSGFRDVTDLKRNRFLAPVRQREDFKQVVADLEKMLAPKREVLPPPRLDG